MGKNKYLRLPDERRVLVDEMLEEVKAQLRSHGVKNPGNFREALQQDAVGACRMFILDLLQDDGTVGYFESVEMAKDEDIDHVLELKDFEEAFDYIGARLKAMRKQTPAG